MAGPTMDPAGLSHVVVLRALEQECGVPVAAKLNEGQEMIIYNSRVVCRDSWLDVDEYRRPDAPDRRMLRHPCAGRGPVNNSMC